MQDEKTKEPEIGQPGETATDWAGLRAQADKLGITLSQLQQLQFEKKDEARQEGPVWRSNRQRRAAG